ncbi:Polysaccharide deacetylase [Thiohalomonas denitrificans]|uniref:Polysaccharide deacetylase n=2 Tax=Thiohalomonas denitrificans TaxID=415747 RepID=A0A1G5PYV0_9GAMM|nr:Polysaccharide deacetylase [Thiohalomonas denitrificans]
MRLKDFTPRAPTSAACKAGVFPFEAAPRPCILGAMRIILSALLLGTILAACNAGAESPGHAVAFMYHRVDDSRYPSTNVRQEDFGAQLDYLEREGFRIWPLERIVRHLKTGMPIPERTIAITFDDAYHSVYENAWPQLRERDWPFTVFVSTHGVDQGLSDIMDWEQMREMQATGVRFANHSTSHDHLLARRSGESAATWNKRVKGDIRAAEARLREELGDAVNPGRLFAYPFGEYSSALADLVEDLGYVGFGQHSGAMGPLSDLRALPRYPINENFSDLDEFAIKANSLPLPVISLTPRDPLVESNNPPRLSITLAPNSIDPERLACYGGPQGRLPLELSGRDENRFSMQASEPFEPGRARYNCTAPSAGGGWYWFSQPWVIPPIAADPNH